MNPPHKLKRIIVAVLCVRLAVGGFGPWGANQTPAAPVPKVKDLGLIWTHNTDTNTLTAYTPDGKEAKKVTLPDEARFLGLTPDGQRMMFAGQKGKASRDAKALTLHIGDISEKCEGTDTGLGCGHTDQFFLSPDGTQVVRSRLEGFGKGLFRSHVLYGVTTRKETKIDLSDDHHVIGWAADGKTWRVIHNTQRGEDRGNLPDYRCLVATVGDKPNLTPLCDTHSSGWFEPHPDRETFAAVARKQTPENRDAPFGLVIMTDGKAKEIASLVKVFCDDIRWSPDGKWIAACVESEADTALVLYASDTGREQKLLTVAKANEGIRLLGWFPATPAVAPKLDEPKARPPVPSERRVRP
jgi:dipeptidyl aminopeptidase/acylaminoacyl peptidase